jgi:thiol-disulfide isomerase/thioredoxin
MHTPASGALAALLALSLAGAGLSCAPQPRSADKPAPSSAGPPPVTPATVEEVLAVVCQPGARAVVLNVWGTWCGPCREEFPDLLRLHRDYRDRGLRLVLLSVDFDSELPQVNRFLAEQGVDFDTYLRSGGDDNAFIDTLSPRWSGALPATFIYDGSGTLRDFWEGKAGYAQMQRRMLRVLEGKGDSDSTEVSS